MSKIFFILVSLMISIPKKRQQVKQISKLTMWTKIGFQILVKTKQKKKIKKRQMTSICLISEFKFVLQLL